MESVPDEFLNWHPDEHAFGLALGRAVAGAINRAHADARALGFRISYHQPDTFILTDPLGHAVADARADAPADRHGDEVDHDR